MTAILPEIKLGMWYSADKIANCIKWYGIGYIGEKAISFNYSIT
jgi:hypothetical protein